MPYCTYNTVQYLLWVGHRVALPEGQLELEAGLVYPHDGRLHQLILLHHCLQLRRLLFSSIESNQGMYVHMYVWYTY